jgi:cell wall-associated NlpC family hydrolase
MMLVDKKSSLPFAKFSAAALLCLALAGCSGLQTGTESSHNNVNNNWSSALAEQGVSIDPIILVQASNHPFSSQALNQLGLPYRWGGKNPQTGFDCSGLVYFSASESIGLKLPRRSVDQARIGRAVKKSDLELGDLVFFNTRGARNSHVGIYLGDNLFVHAPSRNGVVTVVDMTQTYWAKRYNGARRISPLEIASR